MVIQDTPALERLRVVDQAVPIRINVISASKLTVVGYLSDKYSELVIGSTPVQKMIPTSLTQKLHTVKVLALESIGPDLEQVVSFLRCFPYLEKLYIEIRLGPVVDNVIQYNNYVECLDLHLSEITLKSY